MDVSKAYIKMCDCPEIQGQVFDFGDGYNNDNSAYSGKIIDGGQLVWLPRQDQIQEMLPENKCKCSCCLIFHLNQFIKDNIEGFFDAKIESLEQYWLAYYMSEKHQKFWDSKKQKWIKSE